MTAASKFLETDRIQLFRRGLHPNSRWYILVSADLVIILNQLYEFVDFHFTRKKNLTPFIKLNFNEKFRLNIKARKTILILCNVQNIEYKSLYFDFGL